jgi:cellulose synthase/poly-beta-1,6-N-acetylglucosamine synthase-like glycosyltransferase
MLVLVPSGLLFLAGALIVGAYVLWLQAPRARGKAHQARAHGDAFVTVVVPVFDEASLISRKVADVRALTYPRCRVIFVDGGSTDATPDLIPGEWLLRTHLRDKTAQLNAALRVCDSEWILVTDADAALPPDAVERLLDCTGDSIGVVGARVLPRDAHAIESLHWRLSDRLRELESGRGSAGIVTAPCYLVRRSLIADLPPDTIADDVHVACRAMAAGLRVVRAQLDVLELRSPRTLSDLLRHKSRKADAYLREVFRFLPAVARMPGPMRGIFLWRAALLTLVPLLWTLAAALVLIAAPLPTLLATAVVFLVPPARAAALAMLLSAVSAAALLTYPFSRQAASFPKIQTISEEAD